jgi:hypothetical protein
MRTTIVMCAAVAAAAASVLAQANFAGTWVLDAKRSQGLPEGVEMTMTVKQAASRIEIVTNITTPEGPLTIPDLYVVDGKETDYQPPIIGGGTGKGRRTSKWTADKMGIDVTEKATLETPAGSADITAVRKWTLSPDGRTLTMDVTMTGPQGEQMSKRVFTKKE